jgi:hypothetical protein
LPAQSITLCVECITLCVESITLSVESITLSVESITRSAHRSCERDESVTFFSKPITRNADVDALLVHVDTLLVHVVTLRAKSDDDRDHSVIGFDERTPLYDG